MSKKEHIRKEKQGFKICKHGKNCFRVLIYYKLFITLLPRKNMGHCKLPIVITYLNSRSYHEFISNTF